MLEIAIKGSKNYWLWIVFLLAVIGAGAVVYIDQFMNGLMITNMSRDVSFGFYIANFTFLVGVAAGGVMVVIPYYLHNYEKFHRITILGEFLAVAALIMCLLFVLVDVGQPTRLLNVWLYPSVKSVLFWDTLVLNGYLGLNIIIGWKLLEAERNQVEPPLWTKPLIYLSIPFAIGIHTVTAYLYCGLPGRGYWLTAILAPRFLASAFAAGPAFLIILCYIIKKFTKFDPGWEAIQTLSKIVCWAIIANLFFFFCEVFVVFYSNIPGHLAHMQYLLFGYHGYHALVPWMWTGITLMILGAVFLVIPQLRNNKTLLPFTCAMIFIGAWIDKGLGMISGGFVPSPLHHVTEYAPSGKEIIITLAVYATGFLILTILFKIATQVKEEVRG
ncbi:MAG: polysulfide reductase NrfD [Desulfobacula sp.]|jgi:molybdopterin-containing oxidoreductase family membrane subunit|uniref:sulfate reduction electron transfer complex DsrMKJOP subunit DsrP n=1 Tax=Desulfobacula sp. TaxID=2593537 RepID=UPI001D2DAA8E|nr:polysulfide reductase NrfD [Desulfobacula sp.]MBT3487043.1 polysulfide reductase NrfD [Desulfobacula sp.]MBT3806143.1 polysulfide reductase NrfD [Desulfobacula sp.]MBT4026837.1 polysulfide reductase NrfD [Desulfobacula sp.]MBT4199555.1 polysulfide reductase NrfD [Desulfobacula sp.]